MSNHQQGHTPSRLTRRGFLGGIGAGAAGAAGAMATPTNLLAQVPTTTTTRPDRFSRLFPGLPSFAEPTLRVQSALRELGAKGGLLDAKDPLEVGPIRLITEPALSPNNDDNPAMTAGVTFLGQFLDHDMTFDTTSRLGIPARPERSPNTRTPNLDLDSVYGGGPFADTQLYDPGDRVKFKVESGGLFEDLPRGSGGTAVIPDPRNDENLIIAGLQVAFLKFHNNVVDMLRAEGSVSSTTTSIDDEGGEVDAAALAGAESFSDVQETTQLRNVYAEARRLVTWHYQWIIVNEFLPNIVGSALVRDILSRGRRFYRPRAGEQSIPVEFQGAVYRFGHSLVRPSYRANLAGDAGGQPFFGFIFDPAGQGQPDPVDLRGGARASRRFIGWQTFFDFGGDQTTHVRPNKIIDTKISTPLFNLPLGAIASGDPPTSLPQRNLLRHLTWSLPSGQSIARLMGLRPLSTSELRELTTFGVGFERNTPLWYYALKEAELAGGSQLVGVGARIVAEVFLGLLSLDRNSYLAQNSRWRPTLPSGTRGTFRMVDLLRFAGVDPATRRQ
ncbi:MAG TPA: heme peroxidase family protein [Vicinamibacterales bacterium]|nr:heme peroxidase family protein [Vicinamibacterales bacterium]